MSFDLKFSILIYIILLNIEFAKENILEIPLYFIFDLISRHFIGLSRMEMYQIKRPVLKNPYKFNFLNFDKKFKLKFKILQKKIDLLNF